MRNHLGGAVLLVGALALTACEQGDQDAEPSNDEFAERPCAEVVEEFEDAREMLAANFGSGAEGRAAMETIVEAAEQRPDCLTEEEVEAAAGLRYALPASESEAEAVEAAEEACGGSVEAFVTEDPGDSGHPNPEEAIAGLEGARLPDGERDRPFEADGWVGFDYHDEGEYQGWVMVEQGDGGWYVRRAIACNDDVIGKQAGWPG